MAPIAIAIAVATVCAVLTESMVWYMIYRHEDYKKLCNDFEEAQGKLDSMLDSTLDMLDNNWLDQCLKKWT